MNSNNNKTKKNQLEEWKEQQPQQNEQVRRTKTRRQGRRQRRRRRKRKTFILKTQTMQYLCKQLTCHWSVLLTPCKFPSSGSIAWSMQLEGHSFWQNLKSAGSSQNSSPLQWNYWQLGKCTHKSCMQMNSWTEKEHKTSSSWRKKEQSKNNNSLSKLPQPWN